MPRHNLTPAFCRNAKAQPGAERTIYWHTKREGFGLMVTSSDARSFVVQYRAGGQSRRMTINGTLSLQDAEREAKKIQGEVAHGDDPLADRRRERAMQTSSLRAIADEYFAREGKKLRSRDEREAIFKRYIYSRLGARPIDGIKRSEIVRLLDHVEDNHGATAAHHALAALRRLMNWHASRDDDFRSPVVRGMGRVKPKETARSRILTDDELRAVWRAASEGKGAFPAFIKFLLLTAARRREAARMQRSEIEGHDWALPAARNKTKRELVRPLSRVVRDLLTSLPHFQDCDFVFTSDGRRALGGFSKAKRTFDEACGVTGWTLHDLRRTARSLMSRAGVNADVAERCLGHVIPGVRGVYDRHTYRTEMARAYDALAAQIERIIDPQDNVRQLSASCPRPGN
jgi:integrase